jgi:hypothetical protein
MEKEYVTPSSGLKLKWKGVIDLEELYKEMKRWLEDKGFFKEETSEKKYVERRYPGGPKSIEIRWETQKGVSDYFRYNINVSFLLIGVSEAEKQLENGAKKKMHKGDFEIKITAYVTTGSKEWDNMGSFEKVYYNLIVVNRIDGYKADLYDKVYKFHSMIKEFFVSGG